MNRLIVILSLGLAATACGTDSTEEEILAPPKEEISDMVLGQGKFDNSKLG